MWIKLKENYRWFNTDYLKEMFIEVIFKRGEIKPAKPERYDVVIEEIGNTRLRENYPTLKEASERVLQIIEISYSKKRE